jgi:hypothetical protein
MNRNDFEKLLKIRQLLKEAYAHYFKFGDGHCKSSEGHISLEFGNYWTDENCEMKITGVSIYSYVFGSGRDHFFKTVDDALKEVQNWHSIEMSTTYNEYGEATIIGCLNK